MINNPYDSEEFFKKYSQMGRSVKGLAGAGEWKTLEKMLPNFKNKSVLDLGCGFGWHCQYAIEHGASSVVGIDISQKMLSIAKEKTSTKIIYKCLSIEDTQFPNDNFNIVISSLAFHYLKDFDPVARNVYSWLKNDGDFVFSVEHPIFTSYGTQDWFKDKDGNILHFPVDNYFYEGKREAIFLDEKITKYHRTLTTYIQTLIKSGFEITGVVEPQPSSELLEVVKSMKDELRRPMMLIISAKKK